MNFISRIIKSINAMRERLKIERHEAMYGPHFNEECALKAVSKMENEDGSRGEHWSLEETADTIFSNVDTTNNTVTYGICPFQWRQLPCRGLILLNINHTATGATEGSLVSVATSVSSSQVSSNPTSVNTNSGKALLNGSGDQMPTEEIPTVTNTVDNSKEINDLKNDVADIRKMIEDAKKMFMGGFPKPPMPPMPNLPAPMK